MGSVVAAAPQSLVRLQSSLGPTHRTLASSTSRYYLGKLTAALHGGRSAVAAAAAAGRPAMRSRLFGPSLTGEPDIQRMQNGCSAVCVHAARAFCCTPGFESCARTAPTPVPPKQAASYTSQKRTTQRCCPSSRRPRQTHLARRLPTSLLMPPTTARHSPWSGQRCLRWQALRWGWQVPRWKL